MSLKKKSRLSTNNSFKVKLDKKSSLNQDEPILDALINSSAEIQKNLGKRDSILEEVHPVIEKKLENKIKPDAKKKFTYPYVKLTDRYHLVVEDG